MKKIIFGFFCALLVSGVLSAQETIVSHDQRYFKSKGDNVQLLYTEKNLPFAEKASSLERPLHQEYEKYFGFRLDEPLNVGFISDYNQIANGFSTQFPNNRQINYIGGTELPDYFATRSWLDTLIYHETCHNYQLNAKDNPVSSSLHSVFRNGVVFIPYLVVPNIMVNSFLLEGNAVLNESWHGNGGRLYNGRFLAQTLLQVKAGHFTPALMHNNTLHFPYGEHYYTMGSHLQYYLAKTYGLEKANSFFKNNSKFFLFPFLTNEAMSQSVGRDFETVVHEYANSVSADASSMLEAACDMVARSQQFTSLNSDANEIFFIINEDGVSIPKLVHLNRTNREVRFEQAGYLPGKVIKLDGHYYTQGSNKTSPYRIYQGLYDRFAMIKRGTESKMIQGYLHDGTPVYFDVPSSYDHPRLFVGDQFYADVNSSVFIDSKDNLYYCVQENKTRTIYRNKTAVASYQGYYGFVTDVDSQGQIYVIANSRLGSTLYRIRTDNKFERVLAGDNIIEARLKNDDEVFVAATSADEYYYGTSPLMSYPEAPFETTLFFEKEPYYGKVPNEAKNTTSKLDLKNPYHPVFDMNYSGTDLAFGYDSKKGALYNILIRLEDPFEQSALTGFALRNSDQVSLAGLNYQNTQTFLRVNVNGFGLLDDAHASPEINRRVGFSGVAAIPLMEKGYWKSDVTSSYTQDYASNEREPLGISLSLLNRQRFGHSFYDNAHFYADGFGVANRGDKSYGGTLELQKGFSNEWFISVGGKAANSDLDQMNITERRGIKLVSIPSIIDLDPSLITMPSVRDTSYVKKAVKTTATIRKVLNFDQYFFTFPVSLRREAVYGTVNYYSLQDFSNNDDVKETILGLTVDTIFLNSFPIPINFEAIYNNNRHFADEQTFRVTTEVYF